MGIDKPYTDQTESNLKQVLKFYLFLVLCSTLVSWPAESNNSQVDQEVSLGISFAASDTIAPYFYPEQPGGIQYELLKHALENSNMHISHIELAPNKRALRLTLAGKADCLVNAPEGISSLHYTQSLNEYKNSVFTLDSEQLNISSIASLNQMTLLGFQNAVRYLGEDFAEMARAHEGYSEVTNQQSQIVMLFTKRVQAVVLEREIFAHYRRLLKNRVDTSQLVKEWPLFAPAPRKLACKSPQIAQRLNQAIASFRSSKEYQSILEKVSLIPNSTQ